MLDKTMVKVCLIFPQEVLCSSMWMLWTAEWLQLMVQVWVMAWSTKLPLSQWSPRMQEKVKQYTFMPLFRRKSLQSCFQPQTARNKEFKKSFFSSSQVACHWQWRVLQKPRSPARTTKTAPALCPTCPQLPETTTSLSNLTTSTFLAAPLLPRSLVRKFFMSPVDKFFLYFNVHLYCIYTVNQLL